jgi:Flp pilus assembly protein TadG
MRRVQNFRWRGRSGQALIEFVFIGVFMLLLVFGLVDFGRALLIRQILSGVSREGANLASRGTSLADTITAVNTSAAPLSLATNGYVIVTAVYRAPNGSLTVTAQQRSGGIAQSSSVGNVVGGPAVLPPTAVEIPPRGRTLYVVEVFHRYTPVTPLGRLLGVSLPTVLRDVAYF